MLFKVLKSHEPISIFGLIPLNNNLSQNYRIILPKFSQDISRNNFLISACSMWNKCIHCVLDKPILSTVLIHNKKFEIIIPGSNKNSDLTISILTFKNRLKHILLSNQRSGDLNEWSNSNFLL